MDSAKPDMEAQAYAVSVTIARLCADRRGQVITLSLAAARKGRSRAAGGRLAEGGIGSVRSCALVARSLGRTISGLDRSAELIRAVKNDAEPGIVRATGAGSRSDDLLIRRYRVDANLEGAGVIVRYFTWAVSRSGQYRWAFESQRRQAAGNPI